LSLHGILLRFGSICLFVKKICVKCKYFLARGVIGCIVGARTSKQGNDQMTVMQRHPLEASDMAAGRAARAAGIACHYNPFDVYAEPQRYCAWKEGWHA
jgi:hypothetical protein